MGRHFRKSVVCIETWAPLGLDTNGVCGTEQACVCDGTTVNAAAGSPTGHALASGGHLELVQAHAGVTAVVAGGSYPYEMTCAVCSVEKTIGSTYTHWGSSFSLSLSLSLKSSHLVQAWAWAVDPSAPK